MQCLGVVLAGGKSSRMGENKAFLQRVDQDMLDFSKQNLIDAGCSKVIVSGNNFDVADHYQELGPLAGICSVFKALKPQAVLALPVDLPLLSATDLHELKLKGELAQKATFFEEHYLPLYLPNNAFTEMFFANAFSQPSSKGPSVRQLLKATPSQVIIPQNPQRLFNTNTPEDWQKAKSQFTNNLA